MRGAQRSLVPNLGLRAVAHPHGHGDLRGVAHEPQVARVVGGARLAGNGLVHVGLGLGAGTEGHDALEDVGHGSRHLGRDGLGAHRLVLVERVAVAVEDLGDAGGVVVHAAGGQGAVGRGHLKHAAAGGTQGERVVGVVGQVGRDAHGIAGIDDVLHANLVDDLGIYRVAGEIGGLAQADVAIALVLEVCDGPIAYENAVVAVRQHGGVHAGLDGCSERERLERRAGLTACHRGEVELVDVVVAAAHHGEDVAGVGVDAHQGALELVVCVLQHAPHGVLSGRLILGRDGGLDGEAALEDDVGGELRGERRLHVVHEVRVGVGARLLRGRVVEHEVARDGVVVFLLGDVALVEQVGKHDVAALDGAFGVCERVVVGGRLGQARQRGRLGDGEVRAGLAEVRLRRGLDAVAARSIVDGVEVHHEDVVFGVHLLELCGDVGLAHLARQRLLELLVGEHRVAHELLGDGGGAFRAAGQLGHDGAQDALDVDAVVLVEALVLGVHRGPQHVLGALLLRDGGAVLHVELRDDVAVGVEHLRGLGEQVGVGVRVVGQVLEPRHRQRVGGRYRGGNACDDKHQGDDGYVFADAWLGGLARGAVACGHAWCPFDVHM